MPVADIGHVRDLFLGAKSHNVIRSLERWSYMEDSTTTMNDHYR
jgi:hypothetical protein